MTPVRGLGNFLITAVFRVLIGPGTHDLLSGYRGFRRHFLAVVHPCSVGFEIEAEIAGQAVARGLPCVEIPVEYRPRIAGTASKLRVFRDGGRILRAILRQSIRFQPWRPLILLAGAALASGVAFRVAANRLGLPAFSIWSTWSTIVALACLAATVLTLIVWKPPRR